MVGHRRVCVAGRNDRRSVGLVAPANAPFHGPLQLLVHLADAVTLPAGLAARRSSYGTLPPLTFRGGGGDLHHAALVGPWPRSLPVLLTHTPH